MLTANTDSGTITSFHKCLSSKLRSNNTMYESHARWLKRFFMCYCNCEIQALYLKSVYKFLFWNRKITPEVLRIDQYCEKFFGMLVTKSSFSVRFGVAALPSLLPYE